MSSSRVLGNGRFCDFDPSEAFFMGSAGCPAGSSIWKGALLQYFGIVTACFFRVRSRNSARMVTAGKQASKPSRRHLGAPLGHHPDASAALVEAQEPA